MLENPTKSIVFHGCFDGNYPRSSDDISGYMKKCILESTEMVAWKVWLQPGLFVKIIEFKNMTHISFIQFYTFKCMYIAHVGT